MARRNINWIQQATKPENKGLLHKTLGVPKGKKIPLAQLQAAAKKGGKVGERAQFALNIRGLGHTKKKK